VTDTNVLLLSQPGPFADPLTEVLRKPLLFRHVRARALWGLTFRTEMSAHKHGICSMTTVVRCPRTGHACSEPTCQERHWRRKMFERGLSHRGLPLKRKFRPPVSRRHVHRAQDEGWSRPDRRSTATAVEALAPRPGRFRLTQRPRCLALHWATAAPSAKGLGAANLLIVACDTPFSR
jgi:hypothetical protein